MDKINIEKMRVGNAFTKCDGLDSEIASFGNCYDGGDGISCDSCDNCDAPSSDE